MRRPDPHVLRDEWPRFALIALAMHVFGVLGALLFIATAIAGVAIAEAIFPTKRPPSRK